MNENEPMMEQPINANLPQSDNQTANANQQTTQSTQSQPVNDNPAANDVSNVQQVVQVETPFYKRHWKMLLAAAIALLLIVTVPNKQAHMHALEAELMEATNTLDDDDQAAVALGSSIIEKVLSSQLTVDNYLFFSVGSLESDGGSKTVSIGVLTHVFTFGVDEKKFKESFENSSKNLFE